MQETTRKFRINGIDMNVSMAGDGAPVLLVHGFPDDHTVWRNQVAALVEAGYQVIAPDTRGCGDSEILPEIADYRIDKLTADLIALLDVLKIDQVRLVGHDWGAVICWKLLLTHPERVERYVPVSVGHPAAYATGGLAQKIRGYYILVLQLRGIIEWLCRAGDWFLFRQLTRYPAEFPHWRARQSRPRRLTAGMSYYRANFAMMFAADRRRTRVPVYGIWSTGDLFLTEAQMTRSQEFVHGPWRYTRVEGANHWVQLDAPGAFNRVLLDYLK
jgi:pimeloyl-ACP methyl ester carboxylesterase